MACSSWNMQFLADQFAVGHFGETFDSTSVPDVALE